MTPGLRPVTVTPARSLEADCLRLLLRSAGVPVVPEADEDTGAVVLALTRSVPLAAPASAIRMPASGRIPLLLVTDTVEAKSLALARSLRASGLVSWHSPTAAIIDAVRAVSEGGQLPLTDPVHVSLDPLTQLTSRERDVLALIVLGEQDESIGLRLGIGVVTVRSHVQRVLSKLDTPHRQAAAAVARQSPLLSQRLREWRSREQVATA